MTRIVDIELRIPERRGETRPLPAPTRAVPIEVEPDANLGALIDATLRQCHAHILANRDAARSVDDPEGIHQLRVAVRRSRSALRLFRGTLSKRATRPLQSELRWLGDALGPARDWDVFCVETLAEIREALQDAPGLRRLGWEAELLRLHAHQRARDALDSDRFSYLLMHLDRTVRGGEWRDQLDRRARRRLSKSGRKRSARLLDASFAEVRMLERPIGQLSTAQLHALRIRTKRLRYAVEFLSPVHPRRASRRFARRLRVLQSELGRMNDGRVADALVDDLLDRVEALDTDTRDRLARAGGLVCGWVHRRSSVERRDIERAWVDVAGAAPFWH